MPWVAKRAVMVGKRVYQPGEEIPQVESFAGFPLHRCMHRIKFVDQSQVKVMKSESPKVVTAQPATVSKPAAVKTKQPAVSAVSKPADTVKPAAAKK